MTGISKTEATEIAKQAVREVLIELGIDQDAPLEHQKDMAWLRSTRQQAERLGFKVMVTVVSALVVAMLAMLWVGFKSALGK